MKTTMLYQLTETSLFMMSFVLVTQQNNVIVIDGGRPEDMPLLKKYIRGRHISAWILTHAHMDHVSGFVDEMAKNGGKDFDIEKIYYNFPPYEIDESLYIRDREYYQRELDGVLPSFHAVLPLFRDKTHVVQQGEIIQIDELTIEFLFTYHKCLTANLMNDSSLVFKVTAPKKTVLFLGDLGPEGGDALLWESHGKLKADIVQMAHHGHECCGMELYAEIMPKACMWCCADWLYNQRAVPDYNEDYSVIYEKGLNRQYGTKMTRRWMDLLGVKKHYVTMNGTQRIRLS